mmetsp:Transcript_51921/g.86312  ORF Transcript_51921/g.86312 Transcript_51921/m.86312 type:complete len:680 (+) Transcript_51921:62-2101(+)
MSEIQLIVDKLNEPPFQQGLTLVTFDEKSPAELLQLANDVFAILDPKQARDLRDEQPDQTVARMFEFLRILNYKQNIDVYQLKGGNKLQIYPILAWVLSRWPDLQKRAYLARFLVEVPVPQELFQDEDVVSVFQQYKDLQEEFKEAHKGVERLRSSSMAPEQLQKEMEKMEADKEQLNVKIGGLKKKLQGAPNFDDIYGVIGPLRKEMEEATKLAERLKDQQHQLAVAEQKYMSIFQRFKEVKSGIQDGTAAQLLQKLEDETKINRFLANEKLPKDIEERQSRLDSSTKVLATPITETYVSGLQGDIKRLNREINLLLEKRAKQQDPADDKLALFRQQATLVGNKKKKVIEALNGLLDQKKEMEKEIMEKDKQLEGTKGMKVLKGEEFKKYAASLRAKSQKYKQMKADLAEIRAELGILQRTEEVLKSRDHDLQGFLREMESKRGVAGYSDTQNKLEQVSEQKAEIDEMKGKTLEEISEVVRAINESIKERKSKLAPQIKELRQVRQLYTEIETEHNEKKSLYENTLTGLDSERSKLEAEISALRDECTREESAYHYLNCLSSVVDVAKERVTEEAKRLVDKNPKSPALKDSYTAKIQQQETLSKQLRDRQKHIKETHDANMLQLAMFSDLRKLLQCKLNILKQGDGTEQILQNGTNILQLDTMEQNITMASVNRLVIS